MPDEPVGVGRDNPVVAMDKSKPTVKIVEVRRPQQSPYFTYLRNLYLMHILRVNWRKTQKFINKIHLNTKIQIKASFIRAKKLLPEKLWYCVDVAVTGILGYYALTHFNWVSVGLSSAFATYYIEWFVELVKRKPKEE